MKQLQWLLGLCGVVILMAGCQTGAQANKPITLETVPSAFPPLPPLDPDEVALGKEVYVGNCASCHGANLEGESNWMEQNADGSFRAPPHDISGHTWHHADELLIESIVLGGGRFAGANVGGTSNMPAFGDILTEEEIRSVLTYIKSTWPEETQQRQWEVTVTVRNQ